MGVGELDDWGVRMVDRLSARCANGHDPMPGREVPKYCTLCGAPMMVACPNGHVVKIGRFCSICGAPFTLLAVSGEAEPLASNADASGGVGVDPTALLEPTHHPPHLSRLVIAGVVLLVLLIGGGAYFGVSRLTSSSPAHTAAAPVSLAPAPGQAAPVVSADRPADTAPSADTASASASPATPSGSPPVSASSPAATDPASVVSAYYAAINSGDYALAWALGGHNIETGSYYTFVQGFANTVSDNVSVISVANDVVTVHLDATQSDGTHRYFAGTYTVQNSVIVKAAIQQTNS